jgi:hypothetical protein
LRIASGRRLGDRARHARRATRAHASLPNGSRGHFRGTLARRAGIGGTEMAKKAAKKKTAKKKTAKKKKARR